MNKKLQVFVSSTYTDLQEERQAAVEAILDAGHIPAGMELFKAGNESQLKTIYKWIDQSDVYMLILGNHYGAIDSESGLSYTQLEYTYALSKSMPIYAIILDDGGIFKREITNDKFADNHSNLHNIFKMSVLSRSARMVSNVSDLKIAISNILNEYSILNPAIGWGKIPYDQNVNNFVQAIYQQNPKNLTPLFNSTDANNSFKHYYDVYKNLGLDSISSITTNKCIIDPFGNPISDIKKFRVDVSEVNDWMLNELNKNPTDLYQLSSRRFEELVAEILTRKGYKVELTPATRDGGKDIYAARKNDLGSFLYIVECKKYKPTHKVGINVLRDLYGVLSKERATYGVAVTTSYFSKPAQEFQQELQFQMSLQDFNSIKQWLFDVTHT